jgi:hypothetical protein
VCEFVYEFLAQPHLCFLIRCSETKALKLGDIYTSPKALTALRAVGALAYARAFEEHRRTAARSLARTALTSADLKQHAKGWVSNANGQAM